MRDALKNHQHDSRRTIVLKPGSISFQETSIGCLVLNMSAGGAGLVLESDVALPFSFDLEISEDRVRRRCLVAWRSDRQIGVVFDRDQGRGPSGPKS